MNKDYEKRMLIAFVASFILLVVMLFFMPKPKNDIPQQNQTQNTAQTNQTNAAPVKTVLANVNYSKIPTAKATNISLSFSNQIFATVDSFGGRIVSLKVDGSWNRAKEPVSILYGFNPYKPGDLAFGKLENIKDAADRPVYNVTEATSNSVVLTAMVNLSGTPVELVKKFTLTSNYQIMLDVTLRNKGSQAVKIETDGRSFSVGGGFNFFTKDTLVSGNRLISQYFNGRDFKKALDAFLQARPRSTMETNVKWMAIEDYYFIGTARSTVPDAVGKFLLLVEASAYSEEAFGYEFPPVLLAPGESRDYNVAFYTGPKKEDILTKVDPTFSKLFEWPIVFNWFMKPIEWLMVQGMWLFSTFIPNWGVILIILALIIKLCLMPLSVKAAISVKRMNLLQPKMKNLQEKYKDDPKELNVKIAELYRVEKVNPLGGCFPILLQIPVFFALFRVLSTSVELKGATFLWINDLTQPDTLFKFTMPIIGGEFTFNLLPLIMTAIQIVQMKLSSAKQTGAAAQQNMLNTYLMPIIFLFLFWGMPSGLVLYWTVQNVYSIFEQMFVNADRHIKLKKI